MKKQLSLVIFLTPIVNFAMLLKSDFINQKALWYLLTNFKFIFIPALSTLKLLLGTLILLFMITAPFVYLATSNPVLKKKLFQLIRYNIIIITFVSLPDFTRYFFKAPFSETWGTMLYVFFWLYAAIVACSTKTAYEIPKISVKDYPMIAYTSYSHRLVHFIADLLFLIPVNYYWDVTIGFSESLSASAAAAEIAYFLFNLCTFYFLSEALLRQTFGKILTNSCIAGSYDIPGIKNIFIRTLCRLIPFEAFSFLFKRNTHDRLSGTTVVYNQSWKDIVFENEEKTQFQSV